MATSSEPIDHLSHFDDPEIVARLAPIGRVEALAALFAGPSEHDGAAAQALLADLRRRVDTLERQEREASARPEYEGADVIWSYDVSELTQACRALLVALETAARRRPDRAA